MASREFVHSYSGSDDLLDTENAQVSRISLDRHASQGTAGVSEWINRRKDLDKRTPHCVYELHTTPAFKQEASRQSGTIIYASFTSHMFYWTSHDDYVLLLDVDNAI